MLELDDYVFNWDEWADFYPTAREGVTFQDHVWGIPVGTRYRGSVVIRPSMFKAAGMAPEPPSSWEKLNEITPRLTIRDGSYFEQAGFNLQHHSQVYEDWLLQAGGRAFNPDLTKPRNNTQEGRIALSQHVRHGLEDQTMPREGMDSGEPDLHAFCAGSTAIQLLWPGNLSNCETGAPEVFYDVSVGPPLAGPSSRVMQAYVQSLMARKSTKDDAVFETLKYFASRGPYDRIYARFEPTLMPSRITLARLESYRSEPWRSFLRNMRFAVPREVVSRQIDVQPAMSRWVAKAALGEASVPEALVGMDDDVLAIISDD